MGATPTEDLLQSLARCLEAERPAAERAGVSLEARLPADPDLLHPDHGSLERLLRPLIRSALSSLVSGDTLSVGLEMIPGHQVRIEVARDEVFGGPSLGVGAEFPAVPSGLEDLAQNLAKRGGSISNLTSAPRDVRWLLVLPNRPLDEALRDDNGGEMGTNLAAI